MIQPANIQGSTILTPFLTAEWRYLLMANFAVDPALLLQHVPAGTELDSYDGTVYLSVVGFLFLQTQVRGWSLPGHRSFEEVNLRFYVRRRAADGWRRGVVFLREFVPRSAIAAVARRVYHEPYAAVPMSHDIELIGGQLGDGAKVRYNWRYGERWHSLSASVVSSPQPVDPGSLAEFITEHYWGYTRRRDGKTSEYQVTHPRWNVSAVSAALLDCDIGAAYGAQYREALGAPAPSAFVAEGSPITVFQWGSIGSGPDRLTGE